MLASVFLLGLALGVGLDQLLFVNLPKETVQKEEKSEPPALREPVVEAEPPVAEAEPVAPAPEPAPERPAKRSRIKQALASFTTPSPTQEEVKVEAPRPRRRHEMQLPSPEQIEFMKKMWLEQQEQAYARAAELLELDENGVQNLKEIVDGMNERVGQMAVDLVAALREEGDIMRPSPELQMQVMGQIGLIMSETYAAVGEIAPAEHAQDVKKLELMPLINPDKLQPVLDLAQEHAAAQQTENE